jgi:hypothetical protein
MKFALNARIKPTEEDWAAVGGRLPEGAQISRRLARNEEAKAHCLARLAKAAA